MSNHKQINKCSPLVNNKFNNNIKSVNLYKPVNDDTCIDTSTLIKLVKSWNKSYPSDSINENQSAHLLYKELKSKFNNEDDIFWFENRDIINKILDSSYIDKIKRKFFKPIAPDDWSDDPYKWLTNHDINKVLDRYEEKYPTFKSYGAMPIDFNIKQGNSCEINDICHINISNLRKQKKDFVGAVFNLDKHTGTGIHWTSLFVNIPKGEINFWDSTSNPPKPEIVELMNKLKSQMEKIGLNPTININKIQHQYKTSECGTYSIYFIVEQLENGRSFNDVCTKIVDDDKMNSMRKEYFYIDKSKNKTKKSHSFFSFF
jgi:hypothetical protein